MAGAMISRGLRLGNIAQITRNVENMSLNAALYPSLAKSPTHSFPTVTSVRNKRTKTKQTITIIKHKEVIDASIQENLRLKEEEEISTGRVRQILRDQQLPSRIVDDDMPVIGLASPYEKPEKKCILCEHKVDLDYRNARLLSQFISPHTGRIYGRHVTGLCLYMQKRVAIHIKRARSFGYMPYMLKDPRYLRDPKLFNAFRRSN